MAKSPCCWARRNGRRRTPTELQQHAVAYVNTDGNGRGYLMAEGAHSLEAMMNGVARDVQDPESGVTVWKRAQAKQIADAKDAEAQDDNYADRVDLQLGAAGFGHGLHGVPASPGRGVAQPGVWRRRRRGNLPLDLRRFLLVHAFLRYRLRLRQGAGADRRDSR